MIRLVTIAVVVLSALPFLIPASIWLAYDSSVKLNPWVLINPPVWFGLGWFIDYFVGEARKK